MGEAEPGTDLRFFGSRGGRGCLSGACPVDVDVLAPSDGVCALLDAGLADVGVEALLFAESGVGADLILARAGGLSETQA